MEEKSYDKFHQCAAGCHYPGYDLGVATGKMAAKILKGEADISTMPIEYAATSTPKYNPTICEALGLTAPANYESLG